VSQGRHCNLPNGRYSALMKNLRIIPHFLASLLLASITLAQSGDWQDVKDLPSGTRIKLTLKRGQIFGHCEFERANDDELGCYWPHLGPRSYRRENVRAVFLVHNGARIGLAVGFGAGAILGAFHDPTPGLSRGGSALISGGILGGLGMGFGAVLDPFFHGKAVYRSLDRPDKNRPKTSPAPVEPTTKQPAGNEGFVGDGSPLKRPLAAAPQP
jgi:hypothetical protein